ncbi:MAG TPA: protease modulator HflC [Devosia sp.]|jgi:membrane protease subunit HflC|nr:protease modulator HflC [Devosia sp.]
MNRLVIIGIVVIAAIYILVSSIFVVNEREQAIVLRFGQITDVKTEPGIYFKLPTTIVDSVQIVEDRLLRYDVANMTVQVRGGKFYEVDAFLTYRINNPRLFRQQALGDLDVAEARIGSLFVAALRQVYGLREFDAALSGERTAMMREARDLIVQNVAELGIQIVDVRILRTDLTQDVSQQTFELMRAERLAEASFLRARGQEAAQSIRAIADRQAVEIVAAARRDSEILRGEGDAERNSIFASAFGQDPEFFEFYRSMQAYRTALGETGTTMLLSPDSEFFSYFRADAQGDEVPVPAAPGGIAPLPSTELSVPETPDVEVETDLSDSPVAVEDGAAPAAPVDPAGAGVNPVDQPPVEITADPIENTAGPTPAESSELSSAASPEPSAEPTPELTPMQPSEPAPAP